MNKHLGRIVIAGAVMLIMTACAAQPAQPPAQPTPQPTLQPTETLPPEPEITDTPYIIVVTATPEPATATLTATETEVPTATSTPLPKITYTPTVPGAYNESGAAISSEKSMVITGIQNKGSGTAVISWTANGSFSNGFRIYYSYYIKMPSYGSEKFEYAISDGATRSAYITGDPGQTYYYRLCSFTGSGCEFYSNVYTYTFPSATSTP